MVTPIYKNWAPSDSLSHEKFKYFCCLCTPMFSYVTICNTSKSKSDGYSWGILHGRPMEGLAFRYDRHEEITRYIQMRDMHYHSMVMRVLPTFKMFGWFCYSNAIQYNLIFNMFHKICVLISLVNYFCLNDFLYKSPPTIAAIFIF